MSDDEDRDAQELAAFLDGHNGAVSPEDAEVVGLLRHAAGQPALDPGTAERGWQRVSESRPPPERSRWPLVAYAVAAAVVLGVLLYPAAPPPLPPEPSVADYQKAMKALDPQYGPPGARIEALDGLARKARVRLIAELSQ